MNSIQYVQQGESGFRCTVVSDVGDEPRHLEIIVDDVFKDAEPIISGAPKFITNQALSQRVLLFGVSEQAARKGEHEELRKSARKEARRQARFATQLADYVNLGSFITRKGWCSSCFTEANHRVVDTVAVPQICLCDACGEATSPCAAIGCRHMAMRVHGAVRISSYCAEHRHEIRSFASARERYRSLDSIGDLRSFDKSNLAGITRTVVIAGAATVVAAPAAFLLAPAIGGALGASGLIGPALSGAAATSHGLAVLGGGSLAAGGLGMAGGTAVVAATGAALGGTLGAVTTAAYVQDDKSFSIEKLRDGIGAPVIVASGFTTEGQDGWGNWDKVINSRYQGHPVYRVHWGAKELKALVVNAGQISWKVAISAGLKQFGSRAAKLVAKRIPFAGAATITADLAANPWSVARSRAEKTAGILADLLTRVETSSVVLVGHSLGGRVVLRTAELLGTNHSGPKIEDLHLLGAAVGTGGDWKRLSESVVGNVWNYHSMKDPVLKFLYPTVQLSQKAVGWIGFSTEFANIQDIDVSAMIKDHSAYFSKIELR